MIDFLGIRGNRTHAYKIHLERMRQAGKKPVSYQAFCERLRKGWDVNKAIYTPSCEKKIPNKFNMKPSKKWRQILADYFRIG